MKSNNAPGTDGKSGKSFSLFDYISIALLFGAVWGFFEVFLKDVVNMGGKPLTAAIMTGIGVMIMAMGYGLFQRAGIAICITVFTIFTRMIIVPVLGCSPLCRANAVLALLLLGSFTSVAFGVSSALRKKSMLSLGIGTGIGVVLSGVSFYFGGLALVPCQYLSNFQSAGGLTAFLSAEVLYWMLFSVILFYPGYMAGRMMRQTAVHLKSSSPFPYYAGILSGSLLVVLLTGLILLP